MAKAQTPGPRRPKTREQLAARDARAEAAEKERVERTLLRRIVLSLRNTPRQAIPFTEAAKRLGVSVDTLERRAPPPSVLKPPVLGGQPKARGQGDKRAVRYCDAGEVEAMIGPPDAYETWLRCNSARVAAQALLADMAEAELEIVANKAKKLGVPSEKVKQRLDESGTSLLLFPRFAAGLGGESDGAPLGQAIAPERWPFLRYERVWPEAELHVDDVVDLETACIDGVDCAGWVGPRSDKGKRGAVQIEWLTWADWVAVRTNAETVRARVPATTAVLAAEKAVSPSWRRGK